MSKVKVSAIQFAPSADVNKSLKDAERLTREAASNGAQIVLLPELFERQYFCQERRYEYYEFAKSVDDNDAIKLFIQLCTELQIVCIVSFYEQDGNVLYNSACVIDADGTNLGTYRKTHIPDDHYYQEKFYFTPGDTGFKVFKTRFGNVGVGICWDQWFPETARCLAIQGADIIFYPTAIGSEPILEVDSMPHWRRTMQGHAAANIVPVVAANRYGLEEVKPCEENGGQTSSLNFYGSSFMTDAQGEIVEDAPRTGDTILYHEYDFVEIARDRMSWGLFRDRRPECYGIISKK